MTDASAIQNIHANGLDFAYLQAGDPAAPLVLCMHGFPDTAWSFVPVLSRLSQAGFYAVAPFMRGYAPSGLAPDGDYSMLALGRDVLALIEHFDREQAFVVGHDWGALATYVAASLRPDRISRIVTAAVPHMRRFLLRPSKAQLKRSHYIYKFQTPAWPERTLPKDDFAWIENLIRDWSPGWAFSAADLAPLKSGFAEPARLRAALAYYRALPRLATPGIWGAAMKPVPVPARIIYGTNDGCIGPEMFDRQEKHFPNGLDLCCFDGAGHFMQCERPDAFADAVIAHLRPSTGESDGDQVSVA
ncbi:MAG: alpha/beta fold hydrolase [Panacagrimonas sp.]